MLLRIINNKKVYDSKYNFDFFSTNTTEAT